MNTLDYISKQEYLFPLSVKPEELAEFEAEVKTPTIKADVVCWPSWGRFSTFDCHLRHRPALLQMVTMLRPCAESWRYRKINKNRTRQYCSLVVDTDDVEMVLGGPGGGGGRVWQGEPLVL